METSRWTRESLIDFVRGKRLYVRDALAGHVPAPEWLAAVAAEDSPMDSAQSIDATHPDDRNALIEAFVESLASPMVEVSRRIRIDHEGVWQHAEVVWVNLLDHPDVGALVCASAEVDGPEFEPPVRTVEGTMAATNWMIVALDSNGRVTGVRGRLEEILGYSLAEVQGQLLTELMHPDCVADAIENWVRLKATPEQTRTSRWVWRRKDGDEVWLESSYLVHDDEWVEVVVVDVNEQVANEQALAESQREVASLAEDFRLLADEVPTAVFRCDAEGTVQFHNTQWSEMFHGEGPVRCLHELVDPTQWKELDALLSDLAEGSGSASIEVQGSCGTRILEIRCRSVSGHGDGPRVVGSVADVTSAATFRHQALHDPLTGLGNRAMIEATLAEAIGDDPDGTLVVFIDLDGFKPVNDEHGHDAGDAVLVEVGRRLSGAVRPGDSVARYGGDEFVVVCRGVSAGGETPILERLAQVFAPPIETEAVTWEPSASIGVARPELDTDPSAVLRRADEAMFEQKRTHRL